VQKQSFDQSYKNFWSFVDFNSGVSIENSFNKTMSMSTSGVSNTINNFNNNKTLTNGSRGSSGLSYMEARRRADEVLRNSK
jgi:hypothetical protein